MANLKGLDTIFSQANTYFRIDRSKRVCGVFLSQVLSFFDGTAIDLLTRFETEVYRALGRS